MDIPRSVFIKWEYDGKDTVVFYDFCGAVISPSFMDIEDIKDILEIISFGVWEGSGYYPVYESCNCIKRMDERNEEFHRI